MRLGRGLWEALLGKLDLSDSIKCGHMNKVMVILEKTSDEGYSAYLPDLPGCISAGNSLSNIKESIQDAVNFHIEGMKEEHLEIPETFQREYELTYKMDIASLFDWQRYILISSNFEIKSEPHFFNTEGLI